MIPTLIKTLTASNSASLEFVDGASDVVLDNTYDEYMFVFTDIGPNDDSVNFTFQVNATDDAGGGYDTSTGTTNFFMATHTEGDSSQLAYSTSFDMVTSDGRPTLAGNIGNGADESAAGILYISGLASTTYVKQFWSRFSIYEEGSAAHNAWGAGYWDDTTAIDEFHFQVQGGGNFDGVIQLYGIA